MAIKLNPNDAKAYIDRGRIYYVEQKYDAAVSDYSVAIRLGKDLEYAYFGRALAYDRLRRTDKADEDYAAAHHTRPNTDPFASVP